MHGGGAPAHEHGRPRPASRRRWWVESWGQRLTPALCSWTPARTRSWRQRRRRIVQNQGSTRRRRHCTPATVHKWGAAAQVVSTGGDIHTHTRVRQWRHSQWHVWLKAVAHTSRVGGGRLLLRRPRLVGLGRRRLRHRSRLLHGPRRALPRGSRATAAPSTPTAAALASEAPALLLTLVQQRVGRP